MRHQIWRGAAALILALGLGACTRGHVPAAAPSRSERPATAWASAGASGHPVPTPDHVVIVIGENHPEDKVIGPGSYLTALAGEGARFTRSYALTHPSQPNYLALFSGSTQGVTSDTCPVTFAGDNLGHQLLAAGKGFAGYSEAMPSDGYTGCSSGRYARKHNPWVDFTNVPASSNLTMGRFPADYAALPTVAVVVPDLCNDMHDCPVATGDAWLKNNLDGYARWAQTHNSLLIVTFDEDDSAGDNRIPTVFVGQPVRPGTYPERIDHYTVLRTIEEMYGLPCLGAACQATPITDAWR